MACLMLLAGCGAPQSQSGADTSQTGGPDSIPFAQGQYYAVAYLGYQKIENLDIYTQRYLDNDKLPIHYISAGDYYLVIPRRPGMALSLYRNDLERMEPVLIYEDPDCQPFILQCNASDIFADATVQLTDQGETAAFSPFISLKDGTVDVGEYGLDITVELSGS